MIFSALMILISRFSAHGGMGFSLSWFTLLLFYWKEKTIPQHATAIFEFAMPEQKGDRLSELKGRREGR